MIKNSIKFKLIVMRILPVSSHYFLTIFQINLFYSISNIDWLVSFSIALMIHSVNKSVTVVLLFKANCFNWKCKSSSISKLTLFLVITNPTPLVINIISE